MASEVGYVELGLTCANVKPSTSTHRRVPQGISQHVLNQGYDRDPEARHKAG